MTDTAGASVKLVSRRVLEAVGPASGFFPCRGRGQAFARTLRAGYRIRAADQHHGVVQPLTQGGPPANVREPDVPWSRQTLTLEIQGAPAALLPLVQNDTRLRPYAFAIGQEETWRGPMERLRFEWLAGPSRGSLQLGRILLHPVGESGR